MSYNFDAGGRGKTTASCKVYAEPSTAYAGIAALASRVMIASGIRVKYTLRGVASRVSSRHE